MTKREKNLIRRIMRHLRYQYHKETKAKLAQRLEAIWDACYAYAYEEPEGEK